MKKSKSAFLQANIPQTKSEPNLALSIGSALKSTFLTNSAATKATSDSSKVSSQPGTVDGM